MEARGAWHVVPRLGTEPTLVSGVEWAGVEWSNWGGGVNEWMHTSRERGIIAYHEGYRLEREREISRVGGSSLGYRI